MLGKEDIPVVVDTVKRLRALAGISLLVATLAAAPTVTGAPAPALSWSPTTASGTYAFADTLTGQKTSASLQVRNSRGSVKGDLHVSLSGSAAFEVTSDTCTGTVLRVRATCSVTVDFTPAAAGAAAATIAVSTSLSGDSASLALNGTGLPIAVLTWDPVFWDMGDVGGQCYCLVGDSHLFTLTNTGETAATDLVIAMAPDLDPYFWVVPATCSDSLAAGARCTAWVVFEVYSEPGVSIGDVGTLTATAATAQAATATVWARAGTAIACPPEGCF